MRLSFVIRAVTVIGLGLSLPVLAVTLATPAQAQMPQGVSPGTQGFQPMVKPDQPNGPKDVVPPALPGATPGRGAAPADKSVADLGPNEALFDAINRGDIGQARDAIGRGAELNAQNVLGMTPLELSVDLSRNDITFFLLSLRGAGEAKAGAGKATAPVSIAKTSPRPAPAKPAPAKFIAVREKPAARQYAGPSDPGIPDPSAGFLGFGRSVQ